MKAFKKALPVPFSFLTADAVIQTLEGPVSAKAGDALMTGVKGEQWPIQGEKFGKTYDIVGAGLAAKKKVVVEVQEMDTEFSVFVSWANSTLVGKPGDFKVTYGPNDEGVVEREIFFSTYEIIS